MNIRFYRLEIHFVKSHKISKKINIVLENFYSQNFNRKIKWENRKAIKTPLKCSKPISILIWKHKHNITINLNRNSEEEEKQSKKKIDTVSWSTSSWEIPQTLFPKIVSKNFLFPSDRTTTIAKTKSNETTTKRAPTFSIFSVYNSSHFLNKNCNVYKTHN